MININLHMKIQYISDIHLEFCKNPPIINPVAPILCLTGDIGYPNSKIYQNFLINLNENDKFEKIFLIFGNHEYYEQNEFIEETNNKIKLFLQKNNLNKISFLNNSSEFYKEYLFVGSTLWSHISNKKYTTNDLKYIENMTIDKYNELHKDAISFIKSEIESNKDKNIIMLTHFLPSYKLIDEKYEAYYQYNQYFASHNDDFINSPVVLWIYGHTHYPNTSIINNITLVCNPIGYPGENENENKDFEKIIEIS
jgi:predicted phosphodiesterase